MRNTPLRARLHPLTVRQNFWGLALNSERQTLRTLTRHSQTRAGLSPPGEAVPGRVMRKSIIALLLTLAAALSQLLGGIDQALQEALAGSRTIPGHGPIKANQPGRPRRRGVG